MDSINIIKARLSIIFLLLGATLLSLRCCSIYSFSGSTLPSHIKTVSVPLFEDRTSEFGIDQQLTDALIESINKDNTLKITEERHADAIVQGTIVKIEDRSGQSDKNEVASDFTVNITVEVTFRDQKKRKVLWEETWTQWGSYEDDRDEGISEAVEKLASDILNRTVSGW